MGNRRPSRRPVSLPRTPRTPRSIVAAADNYEQYGRYIPALMAGARLARGAYHRYTSTGTQATPETRSFGTQTRYRRNAKITSTRSGGFLSKGSRKTYRTYRKRNFASRKGILATFETGGIAADSDCVYVGHCTCPPNRMRQMMMHALVKAVFAPLGIYPNAIDQPIALVDAGDTFNLQYKANSEIATAPANLTYTLTGTNSPEDIVAWFLADATFIAFTNQVMFLSVAYTPTIAPELKYHRVILNNAKLVISSKSAFKIQNRTVDDIADVNRNDVDNVPLYGKSYSGSGNGVQYVLEYTAERPFICHNLYGIISKPAAAGGSIEEPPIPQHFKGVSKSGKVKLDPGQVKTNSLYYKATIPFYKLLPALFGDITNPTYKKTYVGKFTFFALERMIHAEEATQDLNCAYEHNLEMSAFIIGGYPQPTARIFEQNFFNSS